MDPGMSIQVSARQNKMPDTSTTSCNAVSENSAEKVDADAEYISNNRNHFDNIAARYDDRPGALKLSKAIASAIINNVELDEDSTILMEYACGTGMISRELSPYVKQVVGIDVSQGMVDQFNARVSYQGIPSEEMQAVCWDLKGDESELSGKKFDVIVCSMAYHHFPDLDATTRMLAFFLKEGGALVIVDLVKRSGRETHPEEEQKTCHGQVVAHKGGIDETLISRAFEYAGLEHYIYRPCIRIASKKGEDRLFLARGTKNRSRFD